MINHIYKGIHISGSRVLKQQDYIREMGIEAILRVDSLNRNDGQWEKTFALLDMPFSDGLAVPPLFFAKGTAFIHEQVQTERKMLVHCHMGVSRSVTMVLAYLIEYEKMTLAQAYKTVVTQRPIAYPHDALIHSLVVHYRLPYEAEDIKKPFFLDTLRNG